MDTEAHRRAYELFLAAHGKSEAEAERIIDAAGWANTEIRDEARALLAASRSAGSFMDVSPVGVAENPTPDRIGPYRLVSKIGEGGFGVVYLAEQEAPIRRRVALKLLSITTQDRKSVV